MAWATVAILQPQDNPEKEGHTLKMVKWEKIEGSSTFDMAK